MKTSPIISAIGIIVMAVGTVFHLQGQAVVGPESSFMYSNPDWITYGLEIIVVGSAILVIGFLMKIFWKR